MISFSFAICVNLLHSCRLCFFVVYSWLSLTENPVTEIYPLCSSFDVGTVASIAFLSALQFTNLTNLFPTSLPSENTQCQRDRILSRDPRLKLEFLPRCNADGSYHVIQCSVHLSKCWCVDKSGHKVADAVDGDKGKHCQSKPKGKELNFHIQYLVTEQLRVVRRGGLRFIVLIREDLKV